MGDVNHEPTMEEILASIKKIIAEDGEQADRHALRAGHRHLPEAGDGEILELTEPVADPPPKPEAGGPDDPLVSEATAEASRAALAMLSTIAREHDEAQEAAGSAALEAMVREMIKPMLKDWLDANLPTIIEAMVAREIERITGTRG